MPVVSGATCFGTGLTLIELLFAIAMAGVVFASAWPWCWNVARAANAFEQRAEASSSLAYAQRMFCTDVRRSAGLATASATPTSAHAVSLRLSGATSTTVEVVTYAYDPRRALVWRKAPGAYLAERVTECRFFYYGAHGDEIAPTGRALTPAELESVRRVCLAATVKQGRTVVTWECEATLRAPGGF